MPHKRAKRSVREQQRTQSGIDLAPGSKHAIGNESIPKGVARVLNAAKVQQEWREKTKKRKLGESVSEGKDEEHSRKKRKGDPVHNERATGEMKIVPGESLAHFNRRVEDSMRSVVRSAMQTSSAQARKTKKEEGILKSSKTVPSLKDHSQKGKAVDSKSGKDDQEHVPEVHRNHQERAKEFEVHSSAAPRRLNDIAQAPPELKKPPRIVKAIQAKKQKDGDLEKSKSLRDGMLSMAQKAMLEEERERAIKLYREMKKRQAGG